MTVMTYTSLLLSLKEELNRSDLTDSVLASFVDRAEIRLSRETKTIANKQTVIFDSQPGRFEYPKPTGWRETVSVLIGTGSGGNKKKTLFDRTYEFISDEYPDSTETGEPKYYNDRKNWDILILAPTPDSAYPVELNYYGRPDPLSPENQVNYYTEWVPELLFYASLLESAPYLRDDSRIQIWQGLYDRGLQALAGESIKRITDASTSAKEGL